MITKSKEVSERAKILLKLVDLRRKIEKREEELKKYFKGYIKDGVLDTGEVIIFIEKCTRRDLDKARLEKHLGTEILSQFIKTSTYEKVVVTGKVDAILAQSEKT